VGEVAQDRDVRAVLIWGGAGVLLWG
jgi:hypothetical protein